MALDRPGASRYVIVGMYSTVHRCSMGKPTVSNESVFSATRHEEVLDFMKENFSLQPDILAHGFFRGFVDGEDFANTQIICKTGVEYRMGITEPYTSDIIAN